jgi:hypothetical protein
VSEVGALKFNEGSIRHDGDGVKDTKAKASLKENLIRSFDEFKTDADVASLLKEAGEKNESLPLALELGLRSYFLYGRNHFFLRYFDFLTVRALGSLGLLDYTLLALDCFYHLGDLISYGRCKKTFVDLGLETDHPDLGAESRKVEEEYEVDPSLLSACFDSDDSTPLSKATCFEHRERPSAYLGPAPRRTLVNRYLNSMCKLFFEKVLLKRAVLRTAQRHVAFAGSEDKKVKSRCDQLDRFSERCSLGAGNDLGCEPTTTESAGKLGKKKKKEGSLEPLPGFLLNRLGETRFKCVTTEFALFKDDSESELTLASCEDGTFLWNWFNIGDSGSTAHFDSFRRFLPCWSGVTVSFPENPECSWESNLPSLKELSKDEEVKKEISYVKKRVLGFKKTQRSALGSDEPKHAAAVRKEKAAYDLWATAKKCADHGAYDSDARKDDEIQLYVAQITRTNACEAFVFLAEKAFREEKNLPNLEKECLALKLKKEEEEEKEEIKEEKEEEDDDEEQEEDEDDLSESDIESDGEDDDGEYDPEDCSPEDLSFAISKSWCKAYDEEKESVKKINARRKEEGLEPTYVAFSESDSESDAPDPGEKKIKPEDYVVPDAYLTAPRGPKVTAGSRSTVEVKTEDGKVEHRKREVRLMRDPDEEKRKDAALRRAIYKTRKELDAEMSRLEAESRSAEEKKTKSTKKRKRSEQNKEQDVGSKKERHPKKHLKKTAEKTSSPRPRNKKKKLIDLSQGS